MNAVAAPAYVCSINMRCYPALRLSVSISFLEA